MENRDIPNANIKEGMSSSTGSDVPVVDMSGTNVPDATNQKTPAERAKDIKDTLPKASVKIRLTGSHTHEGIEYEDGDTIEVDESSAKYIVEIAKSGVRV